MKHPLRGYRSGRSRRSFLKGAGALGLTLAAAGRARGTSGFDFRSNFNACPLGPMTTASKHLAWSDPSIASMIDPDNGARFSIVAGGKNGGQCCRTYYPAGQTGEGSEYYRLNFGSIGTIINVEFDWMFETNFDLFEGGGKCCPWIVWGLASGANAGVVQGVWWDSQGSGKTAPRYEFIMQVQRSGYLPHELVVRSYSPNVITPGQWNHFRWQCLGGPGGFANYWMDGQLLASISGGALSPITNLNDPVSIDFGTFVGGATIDYALKYDCWARHDNVRIWSGTG
jgi:hypothetical protein